MAMLAEPRRKVKYSINPQGLDWSKDTSKFGHKLMEKMGWQKGKGLGANEDGHVDHISVRAKQDNRGVGCTAKHADNWIAHQDDFNSLLANLNEDHASEETAPTPTRKVHNLEAKSKKSKTRVHYHKFAKGKDLSMRNEEELNSIFGKRKSASEPCTPQVQSETNSDTESHSDSGKKDHGVITTTSSTNINDYFALKMAQLKAAREKGNERSREVMNDEESTVVEKNDDTSVTSKKKSKKKKKHVLDDGKCDSVSETKIAPDVEGSSEMGLSVCDDQHVKKSKKRKKNKPDEEIHESGQKKKIKKVETESFENDHHMEEPETSTNGREQGKCSEVGVEKSGKKKNKKKKKILDKDTKGLCADGRIPKRIKNKIKKHKNLAKGVHFPGSNIHDITGYGVVSK